MLHNSMHFEDTDQVIGSEFTLKVELLDWVKSIPGKVHRDKKMVSSAVSLRRLITAGLNILRK